MSMKTSELAEAISLQLQQLRQSTQPIESTSDEQIFFAAANNNARLIGSDFFMARSAAIGIEEAMKEIAMLSVHSATALVEFATNTNAMFFGKDEPAIDVVNLATRISNSRSPYDESVSEGQLVSTALFLINGEGQFDGGPLGISMPGDDVDEGEKLLVAAALLLCEGARRKRIASDNEPAVSQPASGEGG